MPNEAIQIVDWVEGHIVSMSTDEIGEFMEFLNDNFEIQRKESG